MPSTATFVFEVEFPSQLLSGLTFGPSPVFAVHGETVSMRATNGHSVATPTPAVGQILRNITESPVSSHCEDITGYPTYPCYTQHDQGVNTDHLQIILDSVDEKASARKLRGAEAQLFVDFLWKVSNSARRDARITDLFQVIHALDVDTHHKFRRRRSDVRRLLAHVAKDSKELPTGLYLEGVERSPKVVYRTGSADIYRGKWEGRVVCAKQLRTVDQPTIRVRR